MFQAAGHKTLIPMLVNILKERNASHIKVIAGGVIPPSVRTRALVQFSSPRESRGVDCCLCIVVELLPSYCRRVAMPCCLCSVVELQCRAAIVSPQSCNAVLGLLVLRASWLLPALLRRAWCARTTNSCTRLVPWVSLDPEPPFPQPPRPCWRLSGRT